MSLAFTGEYVVLCARASVVCIAHFHKHSSFSARTFMSCALSVLAWVYLHECGVLVHWGESCICMNVGDLSPLAPAQCFQWGDMIVCVFSAFA